MSLVEHARRELQLCGQTAEDPAYAQSILAAVAAFASYDGHSGTSAMAAVEQLSTLLRLGTLSPLTADPEEWMEVTDGMWQSRRRPDAFSEDGGTTHYLLDEPLDENGARPRHDSAPAMIRAAATPESLS